MGALAKIDAAETAEQALAAREKAAIEARWIVAKQAIRDIDQVRGDLLKECARPSFADSALYHKPVGRGVEGLSIRFVEQALAAMGNVESTAIVIADNLERRVIEVAVCDYERNVRHVKQITVTKTVERSSPKGQVLGERMNSAGRKVYIVSATDDELLNKEAALVSKALRTCGLRLIPGWLQDEAEQAIKATRRNSDAQDPDAAKRKLLDAFSGLGVGAADLAKYLGHSLDSASPAEIDALRSVYTTIRDGEATWHDSLSHILTSRKPASADDDKSNSDKVKKANK